MAIGFTLPFSKSTGSLGYFDSTAEDVEAVREDLKSLLLTNWGERVMHFQFGCNLKEFIFENIHPAELRSRIADRIVSQVAQWLPFVTIDNLNIALAEDGTGVPENGIGIRIDFRLTARPDFSSKLELVVAQ